MQIVVAVAKENTRLKIPRDCDPILKNIIISLWKERPEKRFAVITLSLTDCQSRMKMKDIAEKLDTYYEKLQSLYEGFDQDEEEEGFRFVSDRSSSKESGVVLRHYGSAEPTHGSVGVYSEATLNSEAEKGRSTDEDSSYSDVDVLTPDSVPRDDGVPRRPSELIYNQVAPGSGKGKKMKKQKGKKSMAHRQKKANDKELAQDPFYAPAFVPASQAKPKEEDDDGQEKSFYCDI